MVDFNNEGSRSLHTTQIDIIRTPKKSASTGHSDLNTESNNNNSTVRSLFNASSTQPDTNKSDADSNSAKFVIPIIDLDKANSYVQKKEKWLLNKSPTKSDPEDLTLRAMDLAAYYSKKEHLTNRQLNLVRVLYTSDALQKNSTDIDNAIANRRATFTFFALISQAKIDIAHLLLDHALPQAKNTSTHNSTLPQQCGACIALLDAFDHTSPIYKLSSSNQAKEKNKRITPTENSLKDKLERILLSLKLPATTNSFLLDPENSSEKKEARKGYIKIVRGYFQRCTASKEKQMTLQNELNGLIKIEKITLSPENQNMQNDMVNQLGDRYHSPIKKKKEQNLGSTSPSHVITATPMQSHLNSRRDAQSILENGVDPLLKTIDNKSDLERAREAGNLQVMHLAITSKIKRFTTDETCDTREQDESTEIFLEYVIEELKSLITDKKPWFNKYSEHFMLLNVALAFRESACNIKVFEDTYARAVATINKNRDTDKQLHPHFYLTIRSPMKEVWNDKLPTNRSDDGYTPIDLAVYIRHFQQQHKNDAANTPIDIACSTLKRHIDAILEKKPKKQKYQRMAAQLKTWKTRLKARSASIPDAVAYINTRLNSFKHIKNIKQRAHKSQQAITGFFAPNVTTTVAPPEYHLRKDYTPLHLRIERNQLRDVLASSNSMYNNIDQDNGHALNFLNDAATYANCATGERYKSALDLSITYAKHDFNKTLEIKNKAIDALFAELLTHITQRKTGFLSNKIVLTKREQAVNVAKKTMKLASTLEEASEALVTLQSNTDIRKHLGFFDSITQRLHINKRLTTTHKKANQINTSTIKSCFPG